MRSLGQDSTVRVKSGSALIYIPSGKRESLGSSQSEKCGCTRADIRRLPWWNKLYRAVKASWLFENVLSKSAEGDFAEALSRFGEIESLVPLESEMLIEKAFLFHATGQYEQSLETFDRAWLYVSCDRSLPDDDRSYLKAYIGMFGSHAAFMTQSGPQNIKAVDMDAIRLENVSQPLKRKYPLVDHPHWEREGGIGRREPVGRTGYQPIGG